jgi:hypothetical protein
MHCMSEVASTLQESDAAMASADVQHVFCEQWSAGSHEFMLL